jgi:hypothetical protein
VSGPSHIGRSAKLQRCAREYVVGECCQRCMTRLLRSVPGPYHLDELPDPCLLLLVRRIVVTCACASPRLKRGLRACVRSKMGKRVRHTWRVDTPEAFISVTAPRISLRAPRCYPLASNLHAHQIRSSATDSLVENWFQRAVFCCSSFLMCHTLRSLLFRCSHNPSSSCGCSCCTRAGSLRVV